MGPWDAQTGVDGIIEDACARFLGEARAHLPLDRLAVVLVDPQQETGRVAFSWKASQDRGLALATATLGSGRPAGQPGVAAGIGIRGAGWAVGALFIPVIPGDDCQPSINVTLQGSQEVLGAALLHAPADECYGPTEQRLARRLAEPLAVTLDNLRLQQRLQRRAEEVDAFQFIAESAASKATTSQVYRRFADQVKRLLEYHHLSIYLMDPEGTRLTCSFHTRVGDRRTSSAVHSERLPTQEWAVAAATSQPHIAQDLGEEAQANGLRSALTTPVLYAERVLGAVRLAHRRHGAYQTYHQDLLQRAASLLGPAIAYSQLRRRVTSQSVQEDKIVRACRVLASGHDLAAVFPDFARTVAELLPLDWVKLSWDDEAGEQWHHPMPATGSGTGRVDGLLPAKSPSISARLLLGGQAIGALTVARGRPGFNAGEQALLKRLAAQVAPVVHSHQLHRQARRQAYQLQQLRQQLAQAPEPEGADRGLVQDAAHALRTPLTAIKGYSSSLLQSDLTWTPEVQHEFLKTIDREADRLDQVVSDLLASPGE